jgi:hypothetical protein
MSEKRPNRMEERRQHTLNAQRAFLRAAAALTEPLGESLAFALLEASVGLLELAKADDDERALKRVTEQLRAAAGATT